MADYTLQVTWDTKDALATDSQLKAISATELGNEFAEISTAVNSKYDSDDRDAADGIAPLDGSTLVPVANLPSATETAAGIIEKATTTEAVTGSDTDRAVTPAGIQAVLDQQGAFLERISQLADAGADRLLMWDDSATGAEAAWMTVGSGLALTATTLTAVIGSGGSQAWDANLDQIAALAPTDSNLLVGNGSAWILESGATLRTSLGLGTGDSPTFTAVTATTLNAGSRAITGATNGLEVDGDAVFSHESTSYASAKIHLSTSSPTSEGNDGDIWYEYTA